MKMIRNDPTPPVTAMVVETVAEHKGIDPDDPDFCLYEDTDPEALENFLARTDGPLTTRLPVDDVTLTVEKTTDGKITVEVEPKAKQPTVSD